jgi:hypothetical protein
MKTKSLEMVKNTSNIKLVISLCAPTVFKNVLWAFLQIFSSCVYPFNIQNKFSKNIQQQQVKRILQKQKHTVYNSKCGLSLVLDCVCGRNATKKF